MAEGRRGGGGGRSGAWRGAGAFGQRKEMHNRGPSSFEISKDGTQFTFPTWQNTPKDPSLIARFSASFKWVGGYSEDEEKNFCNQKSYMNFMNMKYYPSHPSRELKVNLNLNTGEIVEPYTGTPEKAFANLLIWILSNEDNFIQTLGLDEETCGKGGKFVTMRNVLSAIWINYNNKHENSFFATCHDGVVYLLKDDACKKDEITVLHNWGHTLEQLITHSQRNNEKIISNSDYRIVTSFRLGEHRVILSCATDCFNPDKYTEGMDDTSALVTLKCSYDNPNNQKTKKLERYKMFDWCLGLYFGGVPELVVGYRDNCGIVELLKLYDKNDLMEKGQGYWNIESAFVFFKHLLSFVNDRARSKPGKIFHFVKKDYMNTYTCSEIKKEIFPDWFLNEYKKNSDEADPRG